MNIANKYLTYIQKYTIIHSFLVTYPALDEHTYDINVIVDHSEDQPRIDLNIWSDNKREKVLSLVGDLFGKDGWTAVPSGDNIHWIKDIDGIAFRVYRAQVMPPQPPRPVAPSEFPLQLVDVEIDGE